MIPNDKRKNIYTIVEGRKKLMRGSRGGGGSGSPDPPLKNHKYIGVLINTDPDPLKNHKATKTAFNIGPSNARQRNAI